MVNHGAKLLTMVDTDSGVMTFKSSQKQEINEYLFYDYFMIFLWINLWFEG